MEAKRRIPIWIETYGCTLNQSDTDIMRGILREAGYAFSASAEDAEVALLNTCSVKETTENKIIYRIKKLKGEGKKVVVAGCLGINERRVREADKDAVILLPDAVSEVARAVECAIRGEPTAIGEGAKGGKGILPRNYSAPIMRIAVQEGCVGNCHFCHTKIARPKLKSLRLKEIRLIAEKSVEKGAKEIQVTGQDTGAYGMDIGVTLPQMLREVLSVEGDFMVRLGMINPAHAKKFLPEILEFLGNPKFYKFLHVPVQCGSEKVMQEMNRLHTVADFEEVVGGVREEFPDVSISTDIIAGYPTETREDFEETKVLLGRICPDVVNVSKFSSRRGTEASRMKKLPTQEIKSRSRELSELVKKLTWERNSRYVGRVEDVLITEIQKTPTGRMRNYKQVCVQGGEELLGKWVKAKIVDCNHGSLFGEII